MKLYFTQGACSLAVRIILNELNVSFDEESVDLKAKKIKNGEDYRQINPKGAVPAIQLDNGDVLTENQAILQYLADNYEGGQQLLAPCKDIKRYHTLEWLNYISTELHKTVGVFFNPNVSDDIKNNVYLPMIMDRIAFINSNLNNKHYLMGEQFTLPDAYLFVILRWCKLFKFDLSQYKNINDFFERVSGRAAVIKSLEQEK